MILVILLAISAVCAAKEYSLPSNVYVRNYKPQGLTWNVPSEDIEITPRIIGGRLALPAEFPYQVAVFTYFSGGIELCGGTLISQGYVVTAAHCVDHAISARIVLGTTNLTNASQIEAEDYVHSTAFIVHENWSSKLALNDIALIKLSKPVKYSKRIQPVNLPTQQMTSENFVNSIATASGWGHVSDKVDVPSPSLQCVDLKVISEHECKLYFNSAIRPSNICVDGTLLKSTCAGDSGGPLMVKGENGRRTLVGITSFGLRYGCELGYPSVFTRVTSYLDWISEHTGIRIH